MFGMEIIVGWGDRTVILRPFSKEDLPGLVKGFSSLKVNLYTSQLYAQTLENEEEWYERVRNTKDEVVWAIETEGKTVGVTAISNINVGGSCTTGIIIWKPDFWGKGVATRAHLGRTLFAADYLNRLTISSSIRVDNPASLKAVQKVGYMIVGRHPRTCQRQGRFIDSWSLAWLHPERISILYPEGLPRQYEKGVAKAQEALNLARSVITF